MKRPKPSGTRAKASLAAVTMHRGTMRADLGALPPAPLVGYADSVSVSERGTVLELQFADATTGSAIARLVIDLSLVVVAVLPNMEAFYSVSAAWLEKAGIPATAPLKAPKGGTLPLASRASLVRVSRALMEGEIEFYGISVQSIAAANANRETPHALEVSPICRIDMPLPSVLGLIGYLLNHKAEWEARVRPILIAK